MSFPDFEEPAESRRRRGRGRRAESFDDFWSRDSGGQARKGRRRDAVPDDPADVSDLTGPVPSRPVPPRGPSPPRPAVVPPPHPANGRDAAARRYSGEQQALGGPHRYSGEHATVRPDRRLSGEQAAVAPARARARRDPYTGGVDPGADLQPTMAVPMSMGGGRRPVTAPWGAGAYRDSTYTDESYTDDAYDEYDDFSADEIEELPKRRGCRTALIVLGVLVVMAMVTGWFAWSWVQERIDPPGQPGDDVLVEIPEGTTTAGIGDVLAEAGVISDARVWDWYSKLRDVPEIQAGSYRMRLNSSFSEAIDALENDPLPPEVALLVTIPEGLTQKQLVERLTDPERGVPGFTPEGVQAALDAPESRSGVIPGDQRLLEGTLFPETYAVEEGDTEATVVQRMVAQFEDVATEIDLAGRAQAVGRTPYEVLIIASMVEREAGIPEDAPRVARVIYNRIAAGEALGIDATSCYEKGEIPCELTTAELEDDSPYDTRYRPGLPPTPIASPGRTSIEAALAPADGDWMWYVLDAEANDGSSFFTNNYDEFVAAKERCAEAGLGCG
jgi:UPF0755 protein